MALKDRAVTDNGRVRGERFAWLIGVVESRASYVQLKAYIAKAATHPPTRGTAMAHPRIVPTCTL